MPRRRPELKQRRAEPYLESMGESVNDPSDCKDAKLKLQGLVTGIGIMNKIQITHMSFGDTVIQVVYYILALILINLILAIIGAAALIVAGVSLSNL